MKVRIIETDDKSKHTHDVPFEDVILIAPIRNGLKVYTRTRDYITEEDVVFILDPIPSPAQ